MRSPLLLAGLLALAACSAPAAKPATYDPRTDAVPVLAEQQGVAFLLAHQNANGSWGTFATQREREILVTGSASFKAFGSATTALCVKALWQPAFQGGRADLQLRMSIQRAVAYLIAVQVADRGDPNVFCEVWTHAFRAEVMAQVLGEESFRKSWPAAAKVMQADVDSLCRLQSAEGGTGYYDFGDTLRMPTGRYSTSFNTACAIRALLRAQAAGAKVPAGVLAQARRALLAMRSPEGTFLYGFQFRYHPDHPISRPQGASGRTSVCLLALDDMASGVIKAGTFRDGADLKAPLRGDFRLNLQRFRDNYQFLLAAYARPVPHEAYYYNAGYFVTFGLCYAAQAAERLGGEEGRQFAAWEAAEIAALQSDHGSWMDFPMYGYGQYYSTAFAVLALQANARTLLQSAP